MSTLWLTSHHARPRSVAAISSILRPSLITHSLDFPNSANDSSLQKVAARKTAFVILELKGDLSTP
jgi:hypothetical protein